MGEWLLSREGQADRSQARSAWNHEEAFDALSLAHAGAQFRRQISVGLTMTSTVPPGRDSLHRYPGTSCLATISLSPPGQKPFAHRSVTQLS